MKTAKANEQLFKTMKTILKNINSGLIRVSGKQSVIIDIGALQSLPCTDLTPLTIN